jgi:lipoate-protein ligase A
MARDEAILYAVSHQQAPPTLRLYGWQPLCLSLGYGQALADADTERLKARGWGLVRRPTGGKAILHGDELTYSVSIPSDHPLAEGDVVTSYRRISEALMLALVHLGIRPQSEQVPKGNKGLGAVCFEVPSHYEITVNGKKLIGSAQVRRKAGILQHGTLPLTGDIARICDALYYASEDERATAKAHVRARATTLEEALGQAVSYDMAAQALQKGFEGAFGLTLTLGTLTDDEHAQEAYFLTNTYTNPLWTEKR